MKQAIDLAKDISAPIQVPVMELLEQAAWQFPEHLAIKHGEKRWTYTQLIDAVKCLAHQLLSEGVRSGDVIAIHGNKSLSTITAMFSVLWIGCVMLPIDEDLPTVRKATMLKEGSAKYVLLTGTFSETLCQKVKHLAVNLQTCRISNNLSTVDEAGLPSPAANHSTTPAYIFFTSGTTGIPKGILGSHKGLSHFVQWEQAEFAIGPTDRVAQLTNLSFDGILKDIFPPLISGGTLVLPTNNRPFETPLGLLEWLDTEKITIIQTVPSVIASWLISLPTKSSLLKSVRLLCLAGEPLTGKLIQDWRKKFVDNSAEIINLYGPTETTILKSFYRVPRSVSAELQPIGYPLPDTQVFIQDQHGNLCGTAELGEIVIRTKFATLGYINASSEENARFYINPYRDDPEDVLYQTGDCGRIDADGLITIAGRVDDQVKIRGVRIQPSEISFLLSKHSAVGSCVVLPYRPSEQEVSLVAYVVLKDQRQVTAQDLRDHLATYLPLVMLPRFFLFLKKMPLTASGKVNREALPPPTGIEDINPVIEQLTPVQELIVLTLKEVFERENIALHDNFFDLGGHSLLLLQLIARIRKALGIEVDIRVCFEHPTGAQLAAHVEVALTRSVRTSDRGDYGGQLASTEGTCDEK